MPPRTVLPRFAAGSAAPTLVDEAPSLRLSSVPPGQRVRVRASAADATGVVFDSWADYVAGDDGSVVLARDAPTDGTYAGRDAFGLWWSMRSPGNRPFARSLEPVRARISAEVGGDVVASLLLGRQRVAPGVRVSPVRADGVAGTLFLPAAASAAVLVLGGSEGGKAQAEELAALLASRGFAALALAYFRAEGLPDELLEVPVEYGLAAIELLRPLPVGLVGTSRGGEFALLLASRSDAVGAVVGFSASGVLWPAFAPSAPSLRAAWTEDGRPLPFADPDVAGGSPELRPAFERALDGERATRAAAHLERVRCPVLLLSGDDDRLWPAARLAERALARLRHGRHVCYPGAGHGIARSPGLPVPPPMARHPLGGSYSLGGTRPANARAAAAAWRETVSFLRDTLRLP